MPNLKSSKKDVERSQIKKVRNTAAKSAIKTFIRKGKEVAGTGDAAATAESVKKAVSAIDKAVKRGIVHKNTAARKKSRLMLAINKKLAKEGKS